MITNLSGMGVSVPNGFATTADAFNQFLDQSGVNQRIYELLDKTDIDDVTELAKAGAQIRQWIIDTPFQPELENAVRDAYAQLSADDANASLPCVPPLQQKICQMRHSRASRKRSSTSVDLMPYWLLSNTCLPRCLTIAQSPIVFIRL